MECGLRTGVENAWWTRHDFSIHGSGLFDHVIVWSITSYSTMSLSNWTYFYPADHTLFGRPHLVQAHFIWSSDSLVYGLHVYLVGQLVVECSCDLYLCTQDLIFFLQLVIFAWIFFELGWFVWPNINGWNPLIY